MADNARIEELRRRVQKDPASIAFAQLAEEYRRAGQFREAIAVCQNGLGRHPGYLSARVTLGRSLIEVNELDKAQAEIERVLRAAPENLAAIRGLADIHHRRGDLLKALDQYRLALEYVRHDPDLEQTIAELTRELQALGSAPEVPGGLSFEEARHEFVAALQGSAAVDSTLAGAEAPVLEPTMAGPTPLAAAGVQQEPAAMGQRATAVRLISVLEDWLDAIGDEREHRRVS